MAIMGHYSLMENFIFLWSVYLFYVIYYPTRDRTRALSSACKTLYILMFINFYRYRVCAASMCMMIKIKYNVSTH